MSMPRKSSSAELKTAVALEAYQERRMLAQLSSEFSISSEQVCR